MIVRDMSQIEKSFYTDHLEMVIPDLLCNYYERGEYDLVWYFSQQYRNVFQTCEFYLCLSLMDLGYRKEAYAIYRSHKGDWLNICKQLEIYWKHVVVFCLLFQEMQLNGYYEEVFDTYYEDPYVQLHNLLAENPVEKIIISPLFRKAAEEHPALEEIWCPESGKKQQVLTFENMKWRIWKKYNDGIQNGKKNGMETIYRDDTITIQSYQPKEVSASMHILTDGITTIILDCGCQLSDFENVRIPIREILEDNGIRRVAGIFISHAHMDHYGSLNELRHEKIYMTSDTRRLIQLSSPETRLTNVHMLEFYDTFEREGVRVTFLPNGHIRGSVLMDIDWKGKKRIVYTGDFSVEDQQTVPGLQPPELLQRNPAKIDILLTETTYGKRKGMLSAKQYEKIFVKLCGKLVAYGNKILIPVSAIGRAQEIAMLLSNEAERSGTKILIDGKAARITDYYQASMQKQILTKNITAACSELEYGEKIQSNDIILASSGMLRPGSASANYLDEILDKEHVAVLKVGFIQDSEHLLMSLRNRRNRNLHYMDIPLSAHVGYRGLKETLDILAPDYAIYVHGSGID